MIRNVKPDNQKSASLMNMAKITLERLRDTDIIKYPSNTLLDYYDIIHKLMEAITIRDGIKSSGEGAHKELIDYMAKKGKIDEKTRQFMQQMRDYRNRISYEGFMIHKNYVDLNKDTLNSLIKDLLTQLDEIN